MSERKPIGKTIRFEVFKRDKFTCQYCGRAAPDVILEIDHILPVSKNGDNEITNLVTSCFDCNRGKRDRELGDDSVVKKKKSQLDQLQERREQIEMMLDWQSTLEDLDGLMLDRICEYWNGRVAGYLVNDNGRLTFSKLLNRYGFTEITECIRISTDQYLKFKEDGSVIGQTVEKAFDYIEKIAKTRRSQKDHPEFSQLYYIRGILKNRLNYIDLYKAIDLLKTTYHLGISIDELKAVAFSVGTWTEWRCQMETIIEDAKHGN